VEQSHPVQIDSLSSIGAVTQVATGASYTLALMDNGDLYSFGYGANYCLGHDDSASEWQPRRVALDENCFLTSVAAADEHSVAIDSQGQVSCSPSLYCRLHLRSGCQALQHRIASTL
jgi:alpha-tubulin suppressor-like RCC1 family protein